jgi:isoquinoline 1-oxidoreductase
VLRLEINARTNEVEAPPTRTLLDVLRDDLGLTGAKYGCGTGACGACTVLVDGAPAHACVVTAGELDGASVTTVEGLTVDGRLHPVQRAFVERRAMQCGYCTPAMVMSAVALLRRTPDPSADEVSTALAGNVCRCGGYPRIVAAVREAAAALRADGVGAEEELVPRPAGHRAAASGPVWTVTLPAIGDDERDRGWGWTTPGGAQLTIDDAGTVTARVGKVDGGQGNRASLRRMVAAELATTTDCVVVEMGDTATAPHDLGTFGSRSTPDAGHCLRVVAAAACDELVAEAARRWGVPREGLTVAGGAVHDGPDRNLSFGELVTESRSISADAHRPLAAAPLGVADVDTVALRRELSAAATGTKRFPRDLARPAMLHGAVLRPPAVGAKLRHCDTQAARRLPGVTVVEDADFVAVAAPSRELADSAISAMRAEWTTTRDLPAESELPEYLRANPMSSEGGWGGAVERTAGDPTAARAEAELCLDATYSAAYIAHVPMEPRSALAQPGPDAMTVWVGTQRPFAVRSDVATALGLPEDVVRVVVPDFGGGFGGKHTADVAVEAARLARAAGVPVKVEWSREEEFRFGYLRPAAVIDVRSAVGQDGVITSWEFTNINSGAAGLLSPYAVPNRSELFRPSVAPFAQGSYRGLAATANHFARESHMDELAHALGADPVELRRRHLHDERLVQVLDALTERIRWRSRPAASGTGVGIACGVEKDARVATSAMVSVDAAGAVALTGLTSVFDCGAVIDMDGLTAQVTGATIMGIGGALFEQIRFDATGITNASLGSYRVPRFTDVPPVDVLVLDRSHLPAAGAGETPIIAVAPAIGNAIRAATGKRLRALPLIPDGRVS